MLSSTVAQPPRAIVTPGTIEPKGHTPGAYPRSRRRSGPEHRSGFPERNEITAGGDEDAYPKVCSRGGRGGRGDEGSGPDTEAMPASRSTSSALDRTAVAPDGLDPEQGTQRGARPEARGAAQDRARGAKRRARKLEGWGSCGESRPEGHGLALAPRSQHGWRPPEPPPRGAHRPGTESTRSSSGVFSEKAFSGRVRARCEPNGRGASPTKGDGRGHVGVAPARAVRDST